VCGRGGARSPAWCDHGVATRPLLVPPTWRGRGAARLPARRSVWPCARGAVRPLRGAAMAWHDPTSPRAPWSGAALALGVAQRCPRRPSPGAARGGVAPPARPHHARSVLARLIVLPVRPAVGVLVPRHGLHEDRQRSHGAAACATLCGVSQRDVPRGRP
jgi:hypothetical protein